MRGFQLKTALAAIQSVSKAAIDFGTISVKWNQQTSTDTTGLLRNTSHQDKKRARFLLQDFA